MAAVALVISALLHCSCSAFHWRCLYGTSLSLSRAVTPLTSSPKKCSDDLWESVIKSNSPLPFLLEHLFYSPESISDKFQSSWGHCVVRRLMPCRQAVGRSSAQWSSSPVLKSLWPTDLWVKSADLPNMQSVSHCSLHVFLAEDQMSQNSDCLSSSPTESTNITAFSTPPSLRLFHILPNYLEHRVTAKP